MPAPTTLARCVGLAKRYDDVVAVDGLDLQLSPGECLGLLGPNGAGKTTTVEIMEGLSTPTAGYAELFGMRWGTGHDREIRERVGIQLQDTQLADKLTVAEVIRLFRSFYRTGRGVDEVIEMMQLGPKKNARYHKLSGGLKQRVALACALVGRPELLFLDEPTTGLDPQARLGVWDIVERYRQEGGSVLLTTHYMEEAARMCDRLAIMDHGKKIAEGTPNALIASLGGDRLIEVETRDPLDLGPLERLPAVLSAAKRMTRAVLTVADMGAAMQQVLQDAQRRGIEITHLSTHEATLEDVFVALTGRGLRDG